MEEVIEVLVLMLDLVLGDNMVDMEDLVIGSVMVLQIIGQVLTVKTLEIHLVNLLVGQENME